MKTILSYSKISLLVVLLFCVFSCHKKKGDPEPETVQPDTAMTIGTFSGNWTCSVNPGKQGNFDIAAFSLWLPNYADVSKIKAILVLAHHYNGSGLGLIYGKEWQDYAKANNVALLGVHLENTNSSNTDHIYYEAEKGSGQALLMALDAIAKKNNIPAISNLPLLFRGYSAGGMFAYHFSVFQPQRVVAFANIRGWAMDETSDVNKEIPALFLIAELDTAEVDGVNPLEQMKTIVKKKRKQHGRWGYAIEPGEDHGGDLKKSDEFARLFFTSALNYRLANGSNTLLSIPENSGWLGNNDSLTSSSFNTYPSVKENASWLLDETVSDAWKVYQK